MGVRDYQKDSDVDAGQALQRDLTTITSRLEPQDRDDLSQDARLRLLQVEQKEEVQAPLHLLRKITRNLVTDRLRQTIKNRGRSLDLLHQNHACNLPDPERAVIASERLSHALAVINEMPDRRREAFLLHRIDGLSYPQIARKMGVTPKAIEKHIALAMLDLARGMQKIEDNEGGIPPSQTS